MKRLLAAIPLALAASCAMMAPEAPRSEALTDPRGMTLYTFDNDMAGSGKSVCNGPCAAAWPPQYAAKESVGFGAYTIIKRDDGALQWAYKGKPLYLWAKDTKPGDRTGHRVNNVWTIATP